MAHGLPTVTAHTRTCSRNAAHTETGNCTGGTATCTAKAVCETCGSEYGEMKAHNFTAETAEEKYLKSAATCTEKSGLLQVLHCLRRKGTETFEYGNPLGHDYGAWTSNDNGTHTRVCSRDAIHTETENCSGGEATCTEQATCEFCGKKYGEPLGHTYKPEWITNEQRHWHVCARCDHIRIWEYTGLENGRLYADRPRQKGRKGYAAVRSAIMRKQKRASCNWRLRFALL